MYVPWDTYFTNEGHVYSSGLAYSDGQVPFSYRSTRKVLIIFLNPPPLSVLFFGNDFEFSKTTFKGTDC